MFPRYYFRYQFMKRWFSENAHSARALLPFVSHKYFSHVSLIEFCLIVSVVEYRSSKMDLVGALREGKNSWTKPQWHHTPTPVSPMISCFDSFESKPTSLRKISQHAIAKDASLLPLRNAFSDIPRLLYQRMPSVRDASVSERWKHAARRCRRGTKLGRLTIVRAE